jgi:hypothetical protein
MTYGMGVNRRVLNMHWCALYVPAGVVFCRQHAHLQLDACRAVTSSPLSPCYPRVLQ